MLAFPGVEITGFDDFELIGRGGFSTVYRAHQVGFSRQVAIKVLDLDTTDRVVRDLFDQECAAAGRLSAHPHIVTVHDRGTLEDGRPYLVMELCPGGSLAALVRTFGPLPIRQLQALAAQLGGALATAHGGAILHRDVKPHNALRTARGEFALGDFGLAVLFGGHSASMIPAGFTPAFAAPELLVGHNASAATDVYGLAATLHFAASGFPPVETRPESYVAYVGRVLRSDPPRLESIPRRLADAIHDGLSMQPTDRPASIEDFLIAAIGTNPSPAPVLLDEITVEPDQAVPAASRISELGATESRSRRRRRVTIGAAVALATALVGLGAGLTLAGDPSRRSDERASGPTTTLASVIQAPPELGDDFAGIGWGQSRLAPTDARPAIPNRSAALAPLMADLDAVLADRLGAPATELPLQGGIDSELPMSATFAAVNTRPLPNCTAALRTGLVVSGRAIKQWQLGDVFAAVSVFDFRTAEDQPDVAGADGVTNAMALEFGSAPDECRGFPPDGIGRDGKGAVTMDDLAIAAVVPGATVVSRETRALPMGPYEFRYGYRTVLARSGRLVRVEVATNRLEPIPGAALQGLMSDVAAAVLPVRDG